MLQGVLLPGKLDEAGLSEQIKVAKATEAAV
jgi:hypothetical protein